MTENIDKIDTQIVRVLQKNGRLPNTEIAKAIEVSESTVRNRLNRLISDGKISITAIGHPARLGHDLIGSFAITIDHKKTDHVIAELNRTEGLWYITHTVGAFDFFIEFSVKSRKDLDRLLSRLHSTDGIIQIQTSILRKTLKRSYGWWPNKD